MWIEPIKGTKTGSVWFKFNLKTNGCYNQFQRWVWFFCVVWTEELKKGSRETKKQTYSKKEKKGRDKRLAKRNRVWQLSFGDLPRGTESATTHTQKTLRLLICTLRESRITTGGWQKSVMTHPLTQNGLWSRTTLCTHTHRRRRMLTVLTVSLLLSQVYLYKNFRERRKTQRAAKRENGTRRARGSLNEK